MSPDSANEIHRQRGYRADIDGLRAFAVLSVLGFHAELAGFSGGFIGVDVFFVISGYLISGIIFSALDRGTFTYADFYVRRINRIFPALIVVLLATAMLGWTFLYSRELAALGRHIFGGAFYISNFILWSEAGYFDSPLKPLLHLWSLAVEEQFYLLFPFVAVIAWRRRWNTTATIGALIVMSFMLNVWAVRHSQSTAAFYSPFTRVWEILAGALLLSVTRKYPRDHSRGFPAAVRESGSLAGIIVLIACVIMVNENHVWPGVLALLPVAGTTLIIAAGPGALLNRRILGNPILVGIGLISYPLYLWHWPLLVFAKLIYEGVTPLVVRIAILGASTALAWATYLFVEKRIRFGQHKQRSAIRLVPTLAVAGMLGLVFTTAFVPPRLELNAKRSVAEIGEDWEAPQDGSLGPGKGFLAARIPGDTSHTVLLVGDSHAQQYWPRFLQLSEDGPAAKTQYVLIGYGGCPPLPDINRVGTSWDRHPWDCPAFYRAAMAYAARPGVESVILAGFWEDYFLRDMLVHSNQPDGARLQAHDATSDSVFKQFAADLRKLTEAGKKVYVVLSNPTLADAYRDRKNLRRLAGLAGNLPSDAIPKSDVLGRSSITNAPLRLAAKRAGATLIDPVEFLCDSVACPTYTRDGMPIYRDYHHMRAGFVRQHIRYLDAAALR